MKAKVDTTKRPRVTFPELERDGVRAVFRAAWHAGVGRMLWDIAITNPIADVLARADSAVQCVFGEDNAAELWDDLIPTHRRGGECTLQLGCDDATVRMFISALKRNGFRAIPGGSKGGAR